MEYVIISLLTISVFTYIVYIVVNRILAIQMPIKYLILCAFCALLISLILPRILVGFAGITGTLGIVTIFAAISSYCIAYYYDDTMRKIALKDSVATIAVEIAEILPTDTKDTLELIPTQNKILQLNNEENIVEIAENMPVLTEAVTKKYFYPMVYEERIRNSVALESNIILQHNSGIVLNNGVEIDKGSKVFKIKVNFKNKVNKLQIISTPHMLEAIHKHLATPTSNESLDSDPSSNELDVLMDFAFLQKEQRNFPKALNFFRQALSLYPNSEVAPFLIVEIGTILKTLGSYNEAIEVFTEGRLLPGVINNSMLEQEFINNIAYLRIVKNILVKNYLEFMPFNDIPENVFNEIDGEFCEWRNQT